MTKTELNRKRWHIKKKKKHNELRDIIMILTIQPTFFLKLKYPIVVYYLLSPDVFVQSCFKILWIIYDCFTPYFSEPCILPARNNIKVKRVNFYYSLL